MKKVALIVGHSEDSQGAENESLEVSEFMFNEPFAMLVANRIAEEDMQPFVIYREGTYNELPFHVNKTNADIAISLHNNAFNKKQHGTETLFYAGSKKSKRLAGLLQNEIVKCLRLTDRGLKPCNVAYEGKAGDRGGHLLKYTAMPCVITEPFFIDCDESLELAQHNISNLVEAYVTAIKKYFEV